jgi:predicted transposase/invertase (TIGR01784 family)
MLARMAEGDSDIHHPHDKLFAATFSVPEHAAAFLQAKLPPAVAAAIGWGELLTLPGSFVDSQFKASQTDLLFSAPLGGREGRIYLLFEHQSSPDPALPLRLLRYMTRIWERFMNENPASAKLPVILPVVLSQNAQVWHIAVRLSALLDIPEELRGDLEPFIPDFEYRHLQLAEMAFEAIPGTAGGILVLRAMKAERLGRLLDDLVWDENLMRLTPLELLQKVLRYVLAADVDKRGFEDRVKALSDPQTRSTAMTLAQQYHQEGRQEGRQEDILEALELRFGRVPEGLAEAVRQVGEEKRLRELLRAAIRSESLEAFAQSL